MLTPIKPNKNALMVETARNNVEYYRYYQELYKIRVENTWGKRGNCVGDWFGVVSRFIFCIL